MSRPCRVIVLDATMITSAAWMDLSGTAVKVFLIFRTKCKMEKANQKPGKRTRDHVIVNNGELTFTFREAKKKYGLTAPRFGRALDELVRLGFIDVAESGSGLYRDATKFAISERWRLFDTPDFVPAERLKVAIRGCGFTRKNTYHRRRAENSQITKTFTARAEPVNKNVVPPDEPVNTNVHSPEVAMVT